MEACERLLKSLSLPNRGTKTRNIVGNNQAQYGTFGAYSYGSQYGVTKLTEQQPWVTRYLNSFLQKQLKPTARWSSFTVSCDNQLPVHRDVNNRQNFPNYLVGLGSYTGGELWVEGTSPEQPEATCPQVRADGSTLWGHTKPTRHRVVEFNPKVWHSSCKWEGTRIVITAFMTRGYDELGEEIQDWLQRNGFRGQPSGKTSSYAVDEALVIKGPPVWKPKFGTAQKKEEVLAEKAHSEWQAKQRLLRAQHSRSRPAYDFRPGELVYFWRTQESGKHKNAPGSRKGRFLGLARVLATETRRGPEGENRPGSAVWLVRGRQLIKCAPEHLRHASTREELIEALTEENTTPWTYNRVVEQIGGNQYEDLTGTPAPTMTEWHRAQDPSQESQPTRRRIVSKRPAPEPVDEEMPTEESSGHLRRPRVQ
ncbi:GIP, partial [Symbiodinium microadriaticum]